jgi:hypothetical protein
VLLEDTPVKTFLFFALACEAKPFIARFGFKKNSQYRAFEIYQTRNSILTITGVGKSAMAAGVAYSMAVFADEQPPVLVNLGVAGHQCAALGQLVIAEKITDADSAKHYYPQRLPNAPLVSAPLLTVSQPQLNYAPNTLYDMEASAFYETASRFTSSELILIAKVISDNDQSAVHNINARQVTALMSPHTEAVSTLLNQLNQRAQSVLPHFPDGASAITNALHFTVSEKNQLKMLLLRWQALTDNAPLPLAPSQFSSAQFFLSDFNALIKQLTIAL